jgi:RepB DNA-primase N-terminal domain/AAA domain
MLPDISTQHPALTHPALSHLTKLFLPTDTICIGVMPTLGSMDQRFYLLSDFLAGSDKHLRELTADNQHSNIFIAMNPVLPSTTPGMKPLRNRASVGEIGTAYLDIDENGSEQLDAVMAASLAGLIPDPTIILESSPQKFQVIWKVKGFSPTQQEALNRGLVRDYKGDHKSTDCVRFLRLPGFANVKPQYENRPIVQTVHESESLSTREDFSTLDDVLPPKKERSSASSQFEELFDLCGWAPLERAMNVDEIPDGAELDCPFHDHTQPGNFGVIRDNQRLVHCLGTGHGERNKGFHTFDVVGAYAAFYGIAHQYDAARAICKEERELDPAFPTYADIFEKNKPKEPSEHDPLIDKDKLKEEKASWIFENIKSPREELSDKPQSWIIQDFILEHGLHMFSGKPGSMKSMLAILIAKSACCAESFLERKNIGRPINVVYIDRENPESEVRKRCSALGLLDQSNFRIWGDWREDGAPPLKMDDPRLVESAKRDNSLFIFDSLSSYLNGADENSSGEMMEIMSQARSLARASSGVILLHHTPKNGPQSARGAGAITASTDMAFIVQKDGRTVELTEERFRPCSNYTIEFEMDFGPMTGVYTATLVSDSSASGFRSDKNKTHREKTSNSEVDVQVYLKKAVDIIEQSYKNGSALTKSLLTQLLGLSINSQFIRNHLNAKGSNPWTCIQHGRSLVFLPKGMTDIPPKPERPPKPAADAYDYAAGAACPN